ncbi:MAG: Tol-Pal system protein TolB [Rhodospirillaceae bacterium]|nr:Tol-Pal system protein TolB [Rhodospirillaceae bacterium]
MIVVERASRTAARLLGLLLLGLTCVAAFGPAEAELRIDVYSPNPPEPMPIAVPSFSGTGSDQSRGQEVASVIAADLERSGLFRIVDPNAYIQDPQSLMSGPRFADWRIINAEALVSGSVQTQSDGRLRAEFRLWDVIAETEAAGQAYQTEPENWRRIAHIIADQIYERVTGESGFFDTRIVYVSESGPATERVKRLAIMDQDGANHRYLTNGDTLVLTPRFSPTTQEITFLAYYDNRPRVYLFNIDTGQRELLGDFPSMTFAPRFSPDGNSVIMSQAQDGNSDIYVMDLRTRSSRRLTTDPGIDTSPSYSPDGTQIVFESDRGGSQQLYVMGAGGGGAQRISFGPGRYGSPVWSPRGDLIAFTHLSGGQFAIGVMRPDGSGERILAQAYHMEGPTWAPNGRLIMYFSEGSTGQGRSARLHVVGIDGRTSWTVPTPLDGSDPAWSSLLP